MARDVNSLISETSLDEFRRKLNSGIRDGYTIKHLIDTTVQRSVVQKVTVPLHVALMEKEDEQDDHEDRGKEEANGDKNEEDKD